MAVILWNSDELSRAILALFFFFKDLDRFVKTKN